jgi:hypothetical protein
VNHEDGVHYVSVSGPGYWPFPQAHMNYHYDRSLGTPLEYHVAVRLVRKLRKAHRKGTGWQVWFNPRVVPLRRTLAAFMAKREETLNHYYSGDIDMPDDYDDYDPDFDTSEPDPDADRVERWLQHREQV